MGWKIIARITDGKEERIVHTTRRLESHAENALKKYYLDKGFYICLLYTSDAADD